MQAGELKHKISILQDTTELNDEGIETKTTTVFRNPWVSVEHRNPSEKWGDGRMSADVTDMFTMRYFSGVTSDMKISYGSKTYEIKGVEDVRDSHVTLVIQAKEVT